MNDVAIGRLADYLNRLPFVTWDRLVVTENDFTVYGWIYREDVPGGVELRHARADFVTVAGWLPFDDEGELPGFTTSSDRHSAHIHELLYPGASGEANHYPCQRVEDFFGELVERKVVLT